MWEFYVFINHNNKDKPIKLKSTNDLEIYEIKNKDGKIINNKIYTKTILLLAIKKLYSIKENISNQQYKSEKGRIKRGRYEQTINFLIKRGITQEYMLEYMENLFNKSYALTYFKTVYNLDL